MKKLISILLITSLILPFVGTVTWLNHHKKMVRRQVKHQIIAGIDKSELVLLSFTKEEAEELNWKHSKEFEYNGSMYDIVEADTSNNIDYWCWWDYKETKLNKQLYKLLADYLGSDTKNKETKTRFANFYNSLFCSDINLWESINIELQNDSTFTYSFTYTSLHINPPTPPPILA